jgi:hypothetical protein
VNSRHMTYRVSASRTLAGFVATGVLLLAGMTLAPATGIARAQTNGEPERFTALAVNMGTAGRAGAGTVDIQVDRWSTDAERDTLLTVLREQGPDKLLDTLQKMPRVGFIRTPNSIGYDLHFARKNPIPDGGERVTIATDRRIGFWEAANRPRSIDYPFTLIEMRIGKNGEGEGKMSIATKITTEDDGKQIVLENYSSQPVMLTTVKREKKT